MKVLFRTLLVLGFVLGLGACTEKKPEIPKKALTQQQRDSVLAETPLPGAKVVGRAIEVSDSASVRTERLDSRTE